MTLVALHPDNLVRGKKYKIHYAGVTGETVFVSTGVFCELGVRKDDNATNGYKRRLVVIFIMLDEHGYQAIKRALPWYRVQKLFALE